MKFLFVGTKVNLDLNKIGGIESTMRELLVFLKKENYEIQVLLIDSEIIEESEFVTEFGKIPVKITNVFEVRKHLFKRYDVINFLQTPFNNPFFAIYFWGYKIFSKSITTKFYFTYPTLKEISFLQKIKLKLLINHTFVFSKRLENLAKDIVKDVTLLYPPVSNNYISSKAKKNTSKTKILFVGRLCSDKGLDIILNVFKNLPREKYYLGIIGYFANENDNKNYKKELNKLSLDCLEIVTPVTDNKPTLPLSEYDILLLPYQDLGPTLDTPLLILEGLSSNCKIITSNIEPLNYIEGNIWFVDDYLNYLEFLKMINDVSSIEKEKKILDYSTNTFGNLYLKSLKKIGLNV